MDKFAATFWLLWLVNPRISGELTNFMQMCHSFDFTGQAKLTEQNFSRRSFFDKFWLLSFALEKSFVMYVKFEVSNLSKLVFAI